MNSENGSDQPVRDVLKRLSAYLDKLAAQVFDLEDTVGQTVNNRNETNSETITNLQALDFLRQSLEDLALMTLLLATSDKTCLNSNEINDVGKKLKLKTTRSLLAGQDSQYSSRESETRGDLDLF